MTVIYRECLPAAFEPPKIDDVELVVGNASRNIDVEFPQFPCLYTQTYEAYIVDADTGDETPLPDFIVLDD